MSEARLANSCSNISTLLKNLAQADPEEVASIESLGSVIAQRLQTYFATEGSNILLDELKEAGVNLDYKGQTVVADAALSGLIRCINWKIGTSHTLRSQK